MIFSVFEVFFTIIVGASTALLCLVEGFADFSASSLDYFAGRISDKTGRRKALAFVGYSFSTMAKVVLLFASSVVALSLFRIIERMGKSLRGPPRDAWHSELASRDIRGYSFGVHKALDKAGAVLGPLIAFGLLSWLGETPDAFHKLFLIAIVPAMLVLELFIRATVSLQDGRRCIPDLNAISFQQPSSRWLISASVFSFCALDRLASLLRKSRCSMRCSISPSSSRHL